MQLTTRNFIELEVTIPAGTTIQAPVVKNGYLGAPLITGVSIKSDQTTLAGEAYLQIRSSAQIIIPGGSIDPSSGNAPGGWLALAEHDNYDTRMVIPGPPWSVEFRLINSGAAAYHAQIRVFYDMATTETLLMAALEELRVIKTFINEIRLKG